MSRKLVACCSLVAWLLACAQANALEPSDEAALKGKVSAKVLEALRKDGPVDLAADCEDSVSIDGARRFAPRRLPDIIVHVRPGSKSLEEGRLELDSLTSRTDGMKLEYRVRKQLAFIIVSAQPPGDQRALVLAIAALKDVTGIEANCSYGAGEPRASQPDIPPQPVLNVARLRTAAPGVPPPTDQWGLRFTDAPHWWSKIDPMLEPLVAVLDDGVDCKHPALQGRILGTDAAAPWTSAQCPAGAGYDFVLADGDPSHCDGLGCSSHGTHMAAIIAAVAQNNQGYAGVAPTARLLSVRTTDSLGVVASNDERAEAIRYAVDQGANILNISQEWPNWTQTTLRSAVNYARVRGRLINIASGNRPGTMATPPITMGNVTWAMALQSRTTAWPGNTRTCWPRRAVFAPGFDIHGAVINGQIGKVDGSSPATAFLSGMQALLRSVPAYANKPADALRERLFLMMPSRRLLLADNSTCTLDVLCLRNGRACPGFWFPPWVSPPS